LKDHEAAAREAEEEAGVSGKVRSRSIGNYVYRKVDGSGGRPLRVAVFLLRVRRERNRWRERGQRKRAWFDLREAVKQVRESKLRTLIKGIEYATAS